MSGKPEGLCQPLRSIANADQANEQGDTGDSLECGCSAFSRDSHEVHEIYPTHKIKSSRESRLMNRNPREGEEYSAKKLSCVWSKNKGVGEKKRRQRKRRESYHTPPPTQQRHADVRNMKKRPLTRSGGNSLWTTLAPASMEPTQETTRTPYCHPFSPPVVSRRRGAGGARPGEDPPIALRGGGIACCRVCEEVRRGPVEIIQIVRAASGTTGGRERLVWC